MCAITYKESFRFQGNDNTRFNNLLDVEKEYIRNRNNGLNNMNFKGIAALMNCDIQKECLVSIIVVVNMKF